MVQKQALEKMNQIVLIGRAKFWIGFLVPFCRQDRAGLVSNFPEGIRVGRNVVKREVFEAFSSSTEHALQIGMLSSKALVLVPLIRPHHDIHQPLGGIYLLDAL